MDLAVYARIKEVIRSMLDINLDHYKDEQMRRRLDSWLARSGCASWDDYFARLKKEPAELTKFRDYLTINVTEFFRDFDRWKSVNDTILPNLLKESLGMRALGSGVRIWSAGCSIGAEPFSFAMLLDELAPQRKHYIWATDLDRGALTKAQAGGPFTTEEMQNVTAKQKETFFRPGGPPYYVSSNIIRKITFKEHNLLSDPTESDFDMVVCRNVVIYFTAETKDMLYRKFHAALRPGGIMFVGGTEIIPRPQEIGFRSSGFSFYVKV